MDYKNIAIAVLVLVIGGVGGFLLSDGVPTTINLTDSERDQLKAEEARNCNALLLDKNFELNRKSGSLKICLKEEINITQDLKSCNLNLNLKTNEANDIEDQARDFNRTIKNLQDDYKDLNYDFTNIKEELEGCEEN